MHLTPPEDAVAFNEPLQTTIPGSSEGTFTFSPTQAGATFYLPVLAATKRDNTTYEVRLDGNNVFGPAAIPPTDLDDLATTFMPPQTFGQELLVIITNTSGSGRTYTVQPIGWEVA